MFGIVWRVSGRRWAGVLKVSRGCLKRVRMVSSDQTSLLQQKIIGFYDILINPSAHQYQLTIMKWLLVENMEADICRNITRAI